MTIYNFNDRNIQWHTLDGVEHLIYSIQDIDVDNKIVDVLFKLEPDKQILLHRHKDLNKSLVIQGEHRIFAVNGDLKEVRPVGSYTTSPASNEPHTECGGSEGAVVLFSIRGEGGVLYELLDAQQNLIGTLGFQDFIDLYATNSK